MKPKIHPFEFIGAKRLYEEERFLLADEMGMFKTAQAIFANSKFRERNRNLRTLIICPTSVREHWFRELEKWAYPKGEANIIYTEDRKSRILAVKQSDWNIVSYSLMSIINEEEINYLKNIGFHHIILDEAHNAKNPDALRTKAVKFLVDQADYVSLLSGTPIPNTISDLYTLMSLLDPEKYPFYIGEGDVNREARQSFISLYLDRPQAVKELFQKKSLNRSISDFLGEHIPELEIHRIEIPLIGRHLETYQRVVEKDVTKEELGQKMWDLAKASVDPWLINPSLPRVGRNGKDVSLKYNFLDDIVAREMDKKNGKVLIFTDLKEGVVDYLADSYEEYGAIKITGDISPEKGIREGLRQRFQRDPGTRILIATTTMNEGVDLTAATAEVFLTIPWTPADYYQRAKRSHRPGEVKKEKVDLYIPIATILGPQDSLDKATLDMLDSKEKIVKFLTSGIQVSLEELRSYEEPGRVPKIVRAIKSPNKSILEEYIKWRGIGSEKALRRMERNPEVSRFIAELYPNFVMAKNAADIYLPIIKGLESNGILYPKVDIACGPGMLAHFSDEDVIGIDINKDMLMVGKEKDSDRKLIQGKMHELPLENKIAGLALCSLAYQMSEPEKERGQALREMSRILRPRGYAIITLPNEYLDGRNRRKFERIADEYGFNVKDYQKAVGPSKIDVYVLQKIRGAKDVDYGLTFKGDSRR